MSADTHKFLSDLLNIVQYPLIKVGDTSVTLASLFVFVCVIVLVFAAEAILRRYMTRRFLQRTHLHPSMQYAVAKIAG